MSVDLFNELMKAGVRPRLAMAVSRMVAAGGTHLKSSTSTGAVATAAAAAKVALCANIADNWAKVAKKAPAKGKAPPKENVAEGDDELTAEVADELEAMLEKARGQESRDSEEVVKVAYAVARSMGASNEEALCAALYAFTSMPKASELDAEILGAEWFKEE